MLLPAHPPVASTVPLPPLMQTHHQSEALAPQQGDLPLGAIEMIRQDDSVALREAYRRWKSMGSR